MKTMATRRSYFLVNGCNSFMSFVSPSPRHSLPYSRVLRVDSRNYNHNGSVKNNNSSVVTESVFPAIFEIMLPIFKDHVTSSIT